MELIKRINFLYRKLPLGQRLHVYTRYLLCPFDAMEKFVPQEGKILDLGCGHGIFANILALQSRQRRVIGFDLDPERIRAANLSLDGKLNIRFEAADVANLPLDNDLDCVTLIDLPLETDRKFLAQIQAALRPGGVLLIKSIGHLPLWKYYAALVHMATIDRLVRKSWRQNSYFLKEEEFSRLLGQLGFRVELVRIDKHYPCAHCLYICRKSN